MMNGCRGAGVRTVGIQGGVRPRIAACAAAPPTASNPTVTSATTTAFCRRKITSTATTAAMATNIPTPRRTPRLARNR